jgi:adenine-specific DNA-methyltransferase
MGTWYSFLPDLYPRSFVTSRELLNESGSVFVQISDENVHHVREILDEIFNEANL